LGYADEIIQIVILAKEEEGMRWLMKDVFG